MNSIVLVLYLGFSILVAYAGRKVNIGFWGVLVMGIFLTPILTAILIVILRPSARKKQQEDWDY